MHEKCTRMSQWNGKTPKKIDLCVEHVCHMVLSMQCSQRKKMDNGMHFRFFFLIAKQKTNDNMTQFNCNWNGWKPWTYSVMGTFYMYCNQRFRSPGALQKLNILCCKHVNKFHWNSIFAYSIACQRTKSTAIFYATLYKICPVLLNNLSNFVFHLIQSNG